MGITPKDPADFDPTMGNYNDLRPFRFWCQKVLPLVYDDSLSYYEVLCKLVDYLNKTMEDVGVLHEDVDALHTAYQQLQSYVNDYFSTLDVQQEINNKLDVMAADGTLDALILPYFNAYKEEINGLIAQQNEHIEEFEGTINNNMDSFENTVNNSVNTQNGRITTLEGRMDTFTHLTEGSTTGDAELADIRVGGNGVTYNTAGDAVRAQYTELNNDIANQSFVTGVPIVNDIIKELYVPAAVNTDLVTKVRIYNGQGDLYGFKFYKADNTEVLNFTYSSKPIGVKTLVNTYTSNGSMCVFGDVGIIVDAYKDYTITVKSTVHDRSVMPTISAYLLKNELLPFTNQDVCKFIHELYVPVELDLSDVTSVRIYNGYSGIYGFKLFQGTTQKLDFTFDAPTTTPIKKGIAYGVVSNLSNLGAQYKDFTTGVNPICHDMLAMPTIYTYYTTNEILPFTNRDVKEFIREFYVPVELDLSTVTMIRIYNGFNGLYGFKLFQGATQKLDFALESLPTTPAHKGIAYAVITNLNNLGSEYKDFLTGINSICHDLLSMPEIYAHINDTAMDERIDQIEGQLDQSGNSMCLAPTKGQIIYEGDTKSNGNFIVNAVAYEDGVIIACRSNGTVVKIGYDGTEETLLTISGTAPFDWRCCYIDSNENVYVSPHASYGSMSVTDRGLYKLEKGESSFTKVISLYDPNSEVETETENNDDTIWTMCEDSQGNLYAGVYAHTIRPNPAIYKSTDGGDTWVYTYNFKTEHDTPNGMHIHTIIWSKWQKALYVIVGEVNTVFKSTDGAASWTNLNVTLTVKGSSMLATPNGIFIGSDGAYNCDIDLLFNDDKTHKKVFRGWANTVFAIRQSDVTGLIYAFTKIDSSVNSTSYYPPATALTDPDVIDTWHTSVGDTIYNKWKDYYDSVIDDYPDDAIRPQHYAILVSRDGGLNWDALKAFDSSSEFANGFWTTGYFMNGECLTGRMVGQNMVKPIIISEGRHKYVSTGCDLGGEVYIKTNTSSTVQVISSK